MVKQLFTKWHELGKSECSTLLEPVLHHSLVTAAKLCCPCQDPLLLNKSYSNNLLPAMQVKPLQPTAPTETVQIRLPGQQCVWECWSAHRSRCMECWSVHRCHWSKKSKAERTPPGPSQCWVITNAWVIVTISTTNTWHEQSSKQTPELPD